MLQEAHCDSTTENLWRKQWKWTSVLLAWHSWCRHTFPWRLDVSVNVHYKDLAGGILVLEVTVNNLSLMLINVYAPNDDDPDIISNLFLHHQRRQ